MKLNDTLNLFTKTLTLALRTNLRCFYEYFSEYPTQNIALTFYDKQWIIR